MVSVKLRLTSRPETNVSEQSTSAMKPVATLGTSWARTAPSARPAEAMAVVRRTILRRRVTGLLRLEARAGDEAAFTRCPLAGFGKRPGWNRGTLADSKITLILQRAKD